MMIRCGQETGVSPYLRSAHQSRMIDPIAPQRCGPAAAKIREEARPTVSELLARDGVPQSQTEGWIRTRLFSPLARFCLVLGGSLGLDYGVPESGLVDDFSQARCTDDVIDSMHQYYKMRGRNSLWGRLLCPKQDFILKHYWRIRRRTGRLSSLEPQSLTHPKE
jgi:hypothetical protein